MIHVVLAEPGPSKLDNSPSSKASRCNRMLNKELREIIDSVRSDRMGNTTENEPHLELSSLEPSGEGQALNHANTEPDPTKSDEPTNGENSIEYVTSNNNSVSDEEYQPIFGGKWRQKALNQIDFSVLSKNSIILPKIIQNNIQESRTGEATRIGAGGGIFRSIDFSKEQQTKK